MRRVAHTDFTDAKIYTTQYSGFAGVQFSSDPAVVDAAHSPDMLNMIPDESGFPEKRPGYRRLPISFGNAEINGIHKLEKDGDVYYLIKAGGLYYVHNSDFTERLYKTPTVSLFPDEPPELDQFGDPIIERDDDTRKSCAVPYDGNMFVLDGRMMAYWTGTKFYPSSEFISWYSISYSEFKDDVTSGVAPDVFIPTTSINRLPSGGGATYQKVNMLSPIRLNTFVADGSATTFKLDGTHDISSTCEAWYIDSGVSIPVKSVSGDVVTFASAPSKPSIAGVANVCIAYVHYVQEHADMIDKCQFATLYGYDQDVRIMASGNPKYPNRIWYTENNNALYWADTNYIDIGVANYRITGFHKTLAGELAVLKETSEMEATIWHVSASMLSGGDDDPVQGVVFNVREGIKGIGGITWRTQAALKNDVLFLSLDGVYDLKTSFSYSKFISQVQSRSKYINLKLIDDAKAVGFNTAFAVRWRKFYLLFINGNCYVMDENRNWFFWSNMPFSTAAVFGDDLYFGDSKGILYKFNSDLVADGALLMIAFSDGSLQQDMHDPLSLDGGVPITARWTSHVSADLDLFRQKDLDKKGFGIFLKNYTKSSVKVYVQALDSSRRFVKERAAFGFDFNNLNFSDFTFENKSCLHATIRARLRRYAALQIICENAVFNEGFGLYSLQYNFVLGNYFRR